MPRNNLLLDTHVWVWLAAGDTRIQSIREDSSIDSLHLAAISLWEISMLCAKKRLKLKDSPAAWMHQTIVEFGIIIEPLSIAISVLSDQLPGTFHGDPADRLIVATALENNLSLATGDKLILKYRNKRLKRSPL